jgi:hypothetical protein
MVLGGDGSDDSSNNNDSLYSNDVTVPATADSGINMDNVDDNKVTRKSIHHSTSFSMESVNVGDGDGTKGLSTQKYKQWLERKKRNAFLRQQRTRNIQNVYDCLRIFILEYQPFQDQYRDQGITTFVLLEKLKFVNMVFRCRRLKHHVSLSPRALIESQHHDDDDDGGQMRKSKKGGEKRRRKKTRKLHKKFIIGPGHIFQLWKVFFALDDQQVLHIAGFFSFFFLSIFVLYVHVCIYIYVYMYISIEMY